MAPQPRFAAPSWQKRASILLVALCIALTGFAHGLGECAPAQAHDSVVAVLAAAPADVTRDDAADPLRAHMHGEHHQGALCETSVAAVERASGATCFAQPSMRFASRGVTPPQKPPRV
jgi:hypothetical protein